MFFSSSRGIAISLLFMFLVLAGCDKKPETKQPSSPGTSAQAPAPTEVTDISLRLPIPVVDASFAPYYLALDKSIYAEAGLNVSIEPGTPELNPVKMLSQGVDQFAVLGGPELLFSAREKGAPLVAIALIHKDSDFVVILTPKDSGLTTVEQLAGKKVAFHYGHISTDILHMLFAKKNIKVEEVDTGFDYSQLISGQLDAAWGFRTTAGLSLPAGGFEINTISPAQSGIYTQGHIVVTTEKMIAENPELVQRFLDATLKGLSYALDHSEEAVASCTDRNPTFKSSVGFQQLEIYDGAIRRNQSIGWIDEADMQQSKTQMVENGLLDPQFDVSSAFTLRFLEENNSDSK